MSKVVKANSLKEVKQVKTLTEEQKKQKKQKEKINGQIICSIMMMSLGFVIFFDKTRYPNGFIIPSLLTYLALTAGFLFFITLIIVLLRIFTLQPSPAENRDSSTIVSLNQAMKNVIVYTSVFLGLYLYLYENWKKQAFILQILPFILLGTLIFQFGLRMLEFLVDVKGIRYLGQSIALFLLAMLTLQFFTVQQ